jgi:hypothetical protein
VFVATAHGGWIFRAGSQGAFAVAWQPSILRGFASLLFSGLKALHLPEKIPGATLTACSG